MPPARDPHDPQIEWRVIDGVRQYGYLNEHGLAKGPWHDYGQPRRGVALRDYPIVDLRPTPERIALWISLTLGT